ncbi:cytochrome P450 [Symbioplanes lichenis]|uniref:cytochrome P450 n=1 Tax=Symbioplanes lichenis TaxID=1629072 RepID=UPI0027387946|nr:cytochrome P450 [Actinoplanes lichenis]
MPTVADLPEPPGLPVLGHGPALARGGTMHRTLYRWRKQFGSTYRVRLGPASAVVTSATDVIDMVLRERPGTFRRAGYLSDVIDELGGHGLFNAEGDDWRRLRRSAVPGLSVASLRDAFATMVRSTGRLRDQWKTGRPDERVEVLDDLMRYTLEVIGSLTLGHDLDAVRRPQEDGLHQRLPLIASTVVRRMYSPLPYWRLFRLPADRRTDSALAEAGELIAERYADARQRMSASEAPTCYLDSLVKDSLDGGEPLMERDAVGAVVNMLVAGEDNTAAQVAWAMYHLASYPEVQAKVRAKTADVLGDQPFPADAASLARLSYVEAVAKETTRVSPPSPYIIMEAAEDTAVPHGTESLRVDAGTVLILLLDDGTEPGQFRPERHLPGAAPVPASRQFGGGPRLCPGRNLALIESMLLIAMVCHNFTIELDTSRGPVGERVTLSVFPTNLGVRLRPHRS